MKKIFSLWKLGFKEGVIIYCSMLIGFIPILLIILLYMLIARFLFTVPPPDIYLIIILNLVCIIWVPIVFGFIFDKRSKSWIDKNKDSIDV